ncbi:MAG: terminase small subunit [Lautropia sp.]
MLNIPATTATFGELVGVGERKVRDLVEREILRQGATLDRWLLDYCAHIREQAAGRAGHNDAGLTSERARLAKEQADRLEMQNRITRRELAPVSLIEEVLAKAASEVAGIFDGIPGGIRRRAPDIPTETLSWVVEEINRARNRVAALRLDDLKVDLGAADEEGAGGPAS